MASTLRQPKHVLLQIIVSSDLTTTVRSYYDGKVATDPVSVNVGDRVAFLVQLYVNGRKNVPYEITFSDATFFGQPSLTVPAGGVSSFLVVRSLQGKTKYGLNIPGFGTIFDPEIQSGSDGPFIATTASAPANITVTWDTGSNTISYTNDQDAGATAWPLVVNLADKVTFTVTGASVSAASFTFAENKNAWASPFSYDNPKIKLALLSGGPFAVTDSFEGAPGTLFPFSGAATVNSAPLVSPVVSISLK